MEREKPADSSTTAAREPGPARLYALLAGALLCLLGVAGFFYDSSFDTGSSLASDYLAGTLLVNGWRNVVYLASGLIALAFAARSPRTTALALGGFYLAFAIWGLIETKRGIGSILDLLPLGDRDNVFHLVLGLLGVGAGLIDGPRPKVPGKLKDRARKRKRRRKRKPKPAALKPVRTSDDATRKKPATAKKKPATAKRKPAATGEREARDRRRAGPRPDAGA